MSWGGVLDFSRKTSMRGHIEDLDVYGSIILTRTLRKITLVAMKWLHLAQNMFRWRAVVRKAMNEILSSLGEIGRAHV
jgi:hypothetical protein